MVRRSMFRAARLDLSKIERRQAKIEKRIERLQQEWGKLAVLAEKLKQVPTGGK